MTNPTKPLDIEARELLAKHCYGSSPDIKISEALAAISELLTRLREVEGERDEARLHVSKTNNSVFGSYGYFTLPDASQEIERLKESNGNHWNTEQGLRSQLSTSQALLEGVIKCVSDRKAIYQTKRDAADPLAADTLTRWESLDDQITAFEYLETEIASLIEKLEKQALSDNK